MKSLNSLDLGRSAADILPFGTTNLFILENFIGTTRDTVDFNQKKENEINLETWAKRKFAPKFMVFGLLGWSFSAAYFHCHRRRNQRRSRDEHDNLVFKYTFEHMKVNQAELIQAAMTFILILKKNQIKILVGDCDSKLHNEKLADLFWKHGIICSKGCGKHFLWLSTLVS